MLVSGCYALSVLTLIPAVALWSIWKLYLQARKRDVTENLLNYLYTAPPEVPASRAAKVIRRFEELHPYNISQ